MKTMAFKVAGGLFLIVHTKDPPTDDEWTSYVKLVDKQGAEPLPQIVFTEGGGPSAKQRRDFTEMLNGRKIPVVVLTDSTMIRGIVTAISWFNDKLKTFPPVQIKDAFRYLRVPESAWPQIEDELGKLRKELARPS